MTLILTNNIYTLRKEVGEQTTGEVCVLAACHHAEGLMSFSVGPG